jgi:hypothetical protein
VFRIFDTHVGNVSVEFGRSYCIIYCYVPGDVVKNLQEGAIINITEIYAALRRGRSFPAYTSPPSKDLETLVDIHFATLSVKDNDIDSRNSASSGFESEVFVVLGFCVERVFVEELSLQYVQNNNFY